MYYLAWLKEILPPGVMSFEEARTAIISDYQGNLEKMWVEQLKQKYPVKVNEKSSTFCSNCRLNKPLFSRGLKSGFCLVLGVLLSSCELIKTCAMARVTRVVSLQG
jgi:hypothetical protein